MPDFLPVKRPVKMTKTTDESLVWQDTTVTKSDEVQPGKRVSPRQAPLSVQCSSWRLSPNESRSDLRICSCLTREAKQSGLISKNIP